VSSNHPNHTVINQPSRGLLARMLVAIQITIISEYKIFTMLQSPTPWTASLFLSLTCLSILSVIHADVDYASISPIIQGVPPSVSYSRSLQKNRKKPDFGGRLGIANASELSKHKNRIKTIGVQFFAEDSLAIFKQNQSWQETYDYDSSVGYHWFGKSNIGLGTMNLVVKEYQSLNNQTTTVIAG
jgi:hypothetical protein